MALADRLSVGSQVTLDTDSIIYFVEENPDFIDIVAPVWDLIASGDVAAHVSTVSLTEGLVRPLRLHQEELAHRYRRILTRSRNLTLHTLTAPIAEQAAALRAERNLATADAMIAATALQSGCSHLITNDGKYRGIPGLEVLVIREHAEEKDKQ